MESFHANLIDVCMSTVTSRWDANTPQAVQEYSQAFQVTEIDRQREDDRIK